MCESGGFGEIQGCRNVRQGQLGIGQHVTSEGRAHLVGNRLEPCPFRPQSTVKRQENEPLIAVRGPGVPRHSGVPFLQGRPNGRAW